MNRLKNLRIREVSSVDRGAGEGVHVVLFKRAVSEKHPTGNGSREHAVNRRPKTLFEHQQAARAAYDTGSGDVRSRRGVSPETGDKSRHGRQRHLKMEGPLPDKIEKYLARNLFIELGLNKRDVSRDERERLAGEGHALPGGGYPIANVGDLKNAIRAIGRAKNPSKTRSHIRRQAARLGRTDLIPENWSGGVKKLGKKPFPPHPEPDEDDTATKRFGTGRGYRSAGGARGTRRGFRVGKRKPAFLGAAEPFGGDDNGKKPKPSKKTAKTLVKIAADLGATRDLLKNGASFDQMMAEMSSMDYAEGLVEAIRDATHAIKDSIESIADCDDLMPNEKADAIAESLEQFKTHIAGIAPGPITKALKKGLGSMNKLQKKLVKAYHSVPAHDATPPTKDSDTDIDNDADKDVTSGTGINPPKTATTKKAQVKKLKKKLAKLQGRTEAALELSKAERDYVSDAGDDMDADDKKKFLDMSHKKRDKFMKSHPIEQIAKNHLEALPEPIRKQLADGVAATAEVAKMRENAEVADFTKRAATVGQSAEFGGHLRTLAKGMGTEEERNKAFDAVMKALTAGAEQARIGGLFKEFGSSLGGTGSAWDQLMAKAEELRSEITKSGSNRTLSSEQAFAKVYEDPANRELVKQYNAEKNRAV